MILGVRYPTDSAIYGDLHRLAILKLQDKQSRTGNSVGSLDDEDISGLNLKVQPPGSSVYDERRLRLTRGITYQLNLLRIP